MKKGILRPFRYFTNIMDTKEQEIQIGFPTDVKHVAHIGWDGPSTANKKVEEPGAPSWMKDYHSAPLDSASFRSDRGGSAAAAASNPWASQEIVVDGLGDTSFRDTKSDAAGGDSPPSPGARRSRRNRSRDSAATSSMDASAGGGAEPTEKKDKAKKGIRKNRKKDKEKQDKAAEEGGSTTCQDLPAVPKKSNRRKNKGSSEGSGGASAKDGGAGAAPEEGAAPLPQVGEEDKGGTD